MSFWVILQILANLIFIVFGAVLWKRAQRKSNASPNLSQALQVLQNKIAILEDLSDRVETQVKQVSRVLDSKGLSLEDKMLQAQRQIQQVEQSITKSMKVAEIFEDKIPHEEIVERQNTIKYVEAAKLAHAGFGIDEIARKVGLPKNEIRFIAKVNREELVFSESQLPDWIKNKSVINQELAEVTTRNERTSVFKRGNLPKDGVETPMSGSEIAFIEGLKVQCGVGAETDSLGGKVLPLGLANSDVSRASFKRKLLGEEIKKVNTPLNATLNSSLNQSKSSPLMQRAFQADKNDRTKTSSGTKRTAKSSGSETGHERDQRLIQLIKCDSTRSELGVVRPRTEMVKETEIQPVQFPKN